jgi:hypothetical protein
VLHACPGTFSYIDDILVFGDGESHDKNLKILLSHLKAVGLELNEDKCVYRKPELIFMGHVISRGKVRPTLKRVQAIREFERPRTATDLQKFLGLITYVNKFIPHLASEVDGLRKAAREVPFSWSAKLDQEFEKAKKLLSDESYLSLFDPTRETLVLADASPVGLGAVMLQKKDDTVYIICYISCSLSDTERRYSQTEKEALALVFAYVNA